ncbi:helix-turn-helix domain-containing protein [Arsenicibacter rosenii]|uniref:AraC family transcriptional regulator n=1 Tax=Arsenicibacter rosenii TaxID=1750698 RepID=A0A1S2VDH2_9BACT|nr:AraC family transcriptional regulator [Arsenicibacter rosenii]OIN56266.1 AraC family transcriptional regulator [Arsenicibacter rosenii]
MDINPIHSCHLGPDISPEQFIPEHFFMYLLKGAVKAYDGQKRYSMAPGDAVIARKNQLMRYTKFKDGDEFKKIIITLDEPFLKLFLERHPYTVSPPTNHDAFLHVQDNTLLRSYIRSLEPYYAGGLQLDPTFADIKREELLLILLQAEPHLAQVLFTFGTPDKIDLEEFMNRNFRFNVSLERFAFMTGRSLSSFKRDFERIFGTTPGLWLKKRRLEEAHFKITKEHQRPTDVYLEVGFEDLSHFSFAFKKEFGYSPTQVAAV